MSLDLSLTLAYSSDIISATQNVAKPHFPLLRNKRTMYASKLSIIHSDQYRNELGKGFLGLGLGSNICNTLELVCEYTTLINLYQRETAQDCNLTGMIDRRNAVQHTLLSLPPLDELRRTEPTPPPALYEPIRLTALLYALGVTFPLPSSLKTHQKIVKMLLKALYILSFERQIPAPPTLMLWILTLGGISALGMTERGWFIRQIARIVTTYPSEYGTWEDVGRVMHRFLWLDSACDTAGRLLWSEVEQQRHSILS